MHRAGRDTVEVYLDARADVLRVASEVRRMGLGLQADRLEEVADVLVPPTYPGVLARLEAARDVSPRHVEFLVSWMTEAAGIIRELRDDAEITGSDGAMRRADRWLDRLGL